ncbi:MAG: ABC transporter permease [Armatimonadetes bacterium]|nr:ABC transporter permease [Armatimonadota bacterium]
MLRKVPPGVAKLIWPLLALGVVLLYDVFYVPGFFHIEVRDGHLYGSLVDILKNAAPFALLALGMTLVLATKGVDLSVGAVMAVSGAVAAVLVTRQNPPPIGVAFGLALLAALVCGVWNGALVALLDIQPIVATLILMVAGRGIAQLLADGQIITFENKTFAFLDGGFLLGIPVPIFIALAALLIVGALTRMTALGLFIEAVGDNPTASRYAGVPTWLVKMMVYAVCGVCAGVAGLIATSSIKGADASNVGLTYELDAILATVIGGTSLNGGRFFLMGSVLGAVLLQTLTTTIQTSNIKPEYNLVVKAVVIVVVCVLQSEVVRRKLAGLRRGGAQ